ncbi:pneumococcal serine-rich repeat protein-like [Amphibalanus amphitrite]|uniref:pneumococcal serine-rich repeat protein-like n=1 Tax=Amphibalanus amphitrite TaxID=1232801 RepID=UPI001C916171|nr:pneumococcal serine-rich repeat protein-like [Amphibalanus amphitrite]
MSSRASVGQKSSQVICEEIFDEDSIATHDEVLEYARRIGIDPEREPHLLHIADEGVNQSLPPGWKPCFEEEKGLLYYFNFRSGETRWEHPLDAVYRQKVIVARKQAASAEGGVPTGAGAEFGRSRRLCAEEEREKKNVSFAPSVHQIEFDLDEEEEDEDCEDVHDDRLRQLQTPQPPPLHGASWLREKLEDSGRPGGDRLSLLRAPPDRDDSLEMAQDITEDSQLSLHASEGSDSPRRQLERRKEEEVRAALRERRLAEQRRREPSPPPAPAPQPAAVGPAPLTPARLRPLAPVAAPVRGPLAPLPSIGAPRPPPGGLAPLAPLRPVGKGGATAGVKQGTPAASQPAPAAAKRAAKPTPAVKQQTRKPPPAVTRAAEKPTPVAATRSEKPVPATASATRSSNQTERPMPAARASSPAPSDQKSASGPIPSSSDSKPVRDPTSGSAANPSPAPVSVSGASPDQGPGETGTRPVTYQGGRGRPATFTERLLARKVAARPSEAGDSPAANTRSGANESPRTTNAGATATATASTASSAQTVPTITHTTTPPASVTATAVTSTKPSTTTLGVSLTADSIPFIDEASEGSVGESGRSASGRGPPGPAARESDGVGRPGVSPGRQEVSGSGTEGGSTAGEESPRPAETETERPEEAKHGRLNMKASQESSRSRDGEVQDEVQAGGKGASVKESVDEGVVNVDSSVKLLSEAEHHPADKPNDGRYSVSVPSKGDGLCGGKGTPPQTPTTVNAQQSNVSPVSLLNSGGLSRQQATTTEPSVGGNPDHPAPSGSVLSFSLCAQNTPDEKDRERRLRLAAGHSSSESEQDENELRVAEGGALTVDRPGRVRSLYPEESDSGSESESESADSESTPAGDRAGERGNIKKTASSPRDQQPQPSKKAEHDPVIDADSRKSPTCTPQILSSEDTKVRGSQISRQPSVGEESAASIEIPTRDPVPRAVDNAWVRNTSEEKQTRTGYEVAKSEGEPFGSGHGMRATPEFAQNTQPEEIAASRSQLAFAAPESDQSHYTDSRTGEDIQQPVRRAAMSEDRPRAVQNQTAISSPKTPAESSGLEEADRPVKYGWISGGGHAPPVEHSHVEQRLVAGSVAGEASSLVADRAERSQHRGLTETVAADRDSARPPVHSRTRFPPEVCEPRADACSQCDEPDRESSGFAGRYQRSGAERPAAGRIDRSVGPCEGLCRRLSESAGLEPTTEDAAVQTPLSARRDPPSRTGRHSCHRDTHGRRRHSALCNTSDAESSDTSHQWSPPLPHRPRPSTAEGLRRPRAAQSTARPRPPVAATRSCPQCGLGGGGSGVRPTVTVSAPVLGGDGQQPTSPARLAVRQMRHRIRALGMWSDGDGASSDGDRAPPESGGPADVRRILDRAKHFLHGQTAAASRYRRASELQSDSEDVSTDDEERSATERDVQLRAVTRHYGRLKQERSHASDSQLNVRPSSAYQPSRGEQLHSSLAAIHTYRPPPPVRRRPPPQSPPAPPPRQRSPPAPPPRPKPRPERSVLERTQELKAWLRKATVAWKLGSLDV